MASGSVPPWAGLLEEAATPGQPERVNASEKPSGNSPSRIAGTAGLPRFPADVQNIERFWGALCASNKIAATQNQRTIVQKLWMRAGSCGCLWKNGEESTTETASTKNFKTMGEMPWSIFRNQRSKTGQIILDCFAQTGSAGLQLSSVCVAAGRIA